MATNPPTISRQRQGQSGFSLVEFMVAAALGLLVVAAALSLLARHLDGQRRLLLGVRLHQDLRAASDLLARDLRRATHWDAALTGGLAAGAANPYAAIVVTGGKTAASISYNYSRDAANDDPLGFRLQAGALQTREGAGGWQQLTDPNVVRVTQFSLVPTTQRIPLGHLCSPACVDGAAGCPALLRREFQIQLIGQAAADSTVLREIRDTVRIPNDNLSTGSCP